MDTRMHWNFLCKAMMSLVTWSILTSHVTSSTENGGVIPDSASIVSYTKGDHHPPGLRQYEWGEWGAMSSCSQTCGVGITYRKRHCYKSSDHVTHRTSVSLCHGSDRRYEVCNSHPCGDQEESEAEFLEDGYRSRLCARQNRKPYRGRYKRWKPYIQDPSSSSSSSPCALLCLWSGEEARYKLAVQFSSTVPDGTHCKTTDNDGNEGHLGVCITNQCIPIGCDRRLNSSTQVDACGECGGDNSTCTQHTNTINKNLSLGYSDIFTIPIHAEHIKVTEIGESSAVFALRSERGIYFVNSRLSSRNPTVYDNVGGTTFLYYHPAYERDGMEKMTARGPTSETLHVMMLAPEAVVPSSVGYSYTLPSSPQTVTSLWKKQAVSSRLGFAQPSHTTLGPRFLPEERYEENLVQLEYSSQHHTNTIDKHPTSPNKYERTTTETNGKLYTKYNSGENRYNKPSRPDYYWKRVESSCSATCSSSTTGLKHQIMECYDKDHRIVDNRHCNDVTKPEAHVVKCETKSCPPRWEASTWSLCSAGCGPGEQHRGVRCWRMMAPGMDSTVHDSLCRHLTKPATSRPCQEVPCGPLWETTDWSECTSQCGPGVQYRLVRCLHGGCDSDIKPEIVRQCSTPECDNVWVVGEWTQCTSGGCKHGIRKRSVACQTQDGAIVDDKFCDHRQHPLSVERCTNNRATCPPSWVPQAWGKCSVSCGQGVTHRKVVCGHVIRDTFKSLPDRVCQHLPDPPRRAGCQEQTCMSQWYYTEWSKCSKSCGDGGVRVRKVNCYLNNLPSLSCNYSSKPAMSEICKLESCDQTPSTPVPEEPECTDDERTNCGLVVRARLCTHWYYKTACCHTCTPQHHTNVV